MKIWTLRVTVQVADVWVEDGFDMAERMGQLNESIKDMLPYAYHGEMQVTSKIIDIEAPHKD